MTEKEYRAHPSISRSQLFKIAESPEKFKYYEENPEPATPALTFGQLFHAMVLQPEQVDIQFAKAPEVDRRTKAGKEAFADFEEKAQGKIVLSPDFFKQSKAMCDALKKNTLVEKLLKGEKEKAFFWTDELTGESCKCRVDCLTEVGGQIVIVDLKTTENAETESFMRSAIRYGYDFQAAMYCKGVEVNNGKKPLFVFIAIEKKPPYAINILQADELVIQRGYDIFRELLGIYHFCKKNNNWYGYMGADNIINNLALPSYLMKEVQ